MAYVMVKGRKAALPPAKHYYDIIAEGYGRFGFDRKILENALKEVATISGGLDVFNPQD